MSADNRTKQRTISLRLSDEMRERLERVSKLGPYEVSFTAIIERGIVLAEREMQALAETSALQSKKPE
jgi:predicted DNA-binding protein